MGGSDVLVHILWIFQYRIHPYNNAQQTLKTWILKENHFVNELQSEIMSLKITPKWNIFVEKLIPKSCLNCLKINDFLKNDAKANQLKQHRFKTCTPMSLNFETYANKNWTQQRFQNEFQSWIIVCSLSVYNYAQHKSEGKNSIVWVLKNWRAKLEI